MNSKDKSKYPVNWKQISTRIRERAGNCCEWCGIQNHIWIVRSDIPGDDSYIVYDPNRAEYLDAWDGKPIRMSEIPSEYSGKHVRIVLTVAHHPDPDPDPANCADNNLLALCQRCHNRLDAPMRAQHAAETRRNKKHQQIQANGQMPMFGDTP